ncbi:unnamed protein product, partial [Mesorhabditis spiculigera]
MEDYQPLVKEAIEWAKAKGGDKCEIVGNAMDRLFVVFAKEILKLIPGRVSVEVDARLSFDKAASLEKAKRFISLFKDEGIDKERILIKLASTWEGIETARELEKEGIHCNMTLLFNFEQAVACAEAGATLVSPFVGRIMDWYVKNTDQKSFDRVSDPGVKSVQRIYTYYKKFGYPTQVMAASFRNTEQIKGLAGCDLLTISPSLLKELDGDSEELKVVLEKSKASDASVDRITVSEAAYRWALNEDPMSSDKLSEGIRFFARDARLLEEVIKKHL